MLFYAIQALLLSIPLLLLARYNGKFNAFSVLYVLVWTVSVIAIKFRYGNNQDAFYSNDQQYQLEMYARLIRDGIFVAPRQFIADRYVVIVPVRILNVFGFEPLLATKFLQAICVLMLYKVCIKFLLLNSFNVRLYHSIFFTGPLFIFISTLGLRDLEIALAATYFFIGSNIYLRQLSLLSLFLLRPHLAVALIFGWLVAKYLGRFKIAQIYLLLFLITIFSFVVGGTSYFFGANIASGSKLMDPALFQQEIWWRYFSNLVGLQFLTFDERIVDLPILNLIALRLFFIDSFLITICFTLTLLAQKIEFSLMRLQVFISFSFFLGLVAQTEFNSTRQNLPFFSTMGVLALLGLISRSDQKLLTNEFASSKP